jgi:hypothetical protein
MEELPDTPVTRIQAGIQEWKTLFPRKLNDVPSQIDRKQNPLALILI